MYSAEQKKKKKKQNSMYFLDCFECKLETFQPN